MGEQATSSSFLGTSRLVAERRRTRCTLGSGPAPGNLLTDCRECQQNASREGACPIEEGVWYEDTMILDMPEQCPPSPDGPVMPSIFVNPFQTLNVSAFTATPMT